MKHHPSQCNPITKKDKKKPIKQANTNIRNGRWEYDTYVVVFDLEFGLKYIKSKKHISYKLITDGLKNNFF